MNFVITGIVAFTNARTIFEKNYVKIPNYRFPLEIKFSISDPKMLIRTMIDHPMIKIKILRHIKRIFQINQMIFV